MKNVLTVLIIAHITNISFGQDGHSTSGTFLAGNPAIVDLTLSTYDGAPQPRLTILGSTASVGFVGIGTPAPKKNLHVVGDGYFSGRLGIGIHEDELLTNGLKVAGNILTTGNLDAVMVNASGAVDAPTATFNEIASHTGSSLSFKTANIERFVITPAGPAVMKGNLAVDGDLTVSKIAPAQNDLQLTKGNLEIVAGNLLLSHGSLSLKEGGLSVKGNIAVGTTNPKNYKVAVAGKIGAGDLQIEAIPSNWPDFVFTKTYHLRPLEEVEAFIRENGHLEDVPTKKDVENSGYSVHELNAVLLKKVEELTLYVIEQQKQIDELKRSSRQ